MNIIITKLNVRKRTKKMPDFKQGKIYSIRSHQTEEIYIGSTTQPLSKRLGGHKANYKRYKNGKHHYTSSFKILDFDDCYIELVQNYPCNDKNELTRREGELIRETDCVNKFVAGRSDREYREENKEKISKKNKDYYNANKQEIKNKSKAYYNVNKQEIKNKSKDYYEANKQKILQKWKQKIECQCGGRYTVGHKSHHFKSKIHTDFIQSNSD